MTDNFFSHQQPISFYSDGLELKGSLYVPPVKQPNVVIGSHGLESSGNSPKQMSLAQKCFSMNIAYLRFDHRGCGESEGIFEKVTSLKARCNDLISAINFVLKREDLGNNICLFGSSFGGTTCLSTANIINTTPFENSLFVSNFYLNGIVICATPVNSLFIIVDNFLEINKKHSIEFYKQNLQFDIAHKIKNISNILIFHGDADEVVPVDHANIIYSSVKNPKKLIIHKNGDHRMSDLQHQADFINETSAWLKNIF